MANASEPRTSFSLITVGPFARLWWSSVVGSTGDWITIFATIALGDAIAGGQGVLVAIASRIVPGLLFGAAAGVLTDRFDRRRLIVVADLGRAAVVPLLLFATTLPILVVISLAAEFLSLLGQAPRVAIVPRLVRRVNIVNANGLILAATYGTVPLGAGFNWFLSSLPAVTFGGFVPDQTAGLALAFLLDSATFIASGLMIAKLPAIRTEAAEARSNKEDGSVQSSVRDLIDGVRFVMERPTVRRVIVGITAALFGGGVIIAVGPSFVQDVLQAGQTGFFAIVTSLGLGAGAGVVVVSSYGTKLIRRDVVFALATVTTGVGLAATAPAQTVFGAAAWVSVMGFGAGAAYVMGLTHLHEEVDDDIQGRVLASLFALMRVALFVSMFVAVPLEGALARYGPAALSSDPSRVVIFLGGVVIVASGVTVLWGLRHLLKRPKMGPEAREWMAGTTEAMRGRQPDDDEGER